MGSALAPVLAGLELLGDGVAEVCLAEVVGGAFGVAVGTGSMLISPSSIM